MNDETARMRRFSDAPIFRAVVSLAAPTVVSQVILVIYSMADAFFIGQTGDNVKITAVAVCLPAFMVLSAISNLFGIGGAAAVSRALGANRPVRARLASGFAFWGGLASTLLLALMSFVFRHSLIDALGGLQPRLHAECEKYLFWTVTVGGAGTALNALLGHLLRAEGRSLQAGLGIALGGALNIALDPLFMFVLLPAGQEVIGAAVATALSNLLATAYFLGVKGANRMRSALSIAPRRGCLRNGIPGEVLRSGLPACLMTLFENLSYAVLDNRMAATGLLECQTGLGIAKKVNMLAHSIVRGMSQGVLPLIAYNYAARNRLRVRRTILLSSGICVTLALGCSGVSLCFSRALVGLFIRGRQDSGALECGARMLRILCLGCPFSAFAYAVISFFQAVDRSRRAFLLAVLRKGLLDIPLMLILARRLPVDSPVWATPIADGLCCAAAAALLPGFWRQFPGTQEKKPRFPSSG